ncbi:MAG: bifunctional oligoribonuclease/PAP phosphatase NrnA [Candidatus Moranbacteria bacterium]|jgi:phosphoesterase RecJ-like protein|nr:bifunctional oligoribonuclease/PAP phosphatase NrnA [Candidatus Moranbacteria bacterium]
MRDFFKEWKTLRYVTKNASRVLLFAHSRPDPDTVGANIALKYFLEQEGKKVDIGCFDHFPPNLRPLFDEKFLHPDLLDLASYDAVIACDSVDRGFDKIAPHLQPETVTVLIDHHPDILLSGDIVIIDPEYSSSSELIYLFLQSAGITLTKPVATALLLGLMFDTGAFQHANVTAQVMSIASELMQRGAPANRIAELIFSKKKVAALKLWGKAFERARLHPQSGLLTTVITQQDVDECEALIDDIYQVTTILSAVPEAKYVLVLSERESGMVRGSLRSLEHHAIDVSAIAKTLGGGGHKLASGFEVPGKIIETDYGWQIVPEFH